MADFLVGAGQTYTDLQAAINAVGALGALVADQNIIIDNVFVHTGAIDFSSVQGSASGRLTLTSAGTYTLNLPSQTDLTGYITIEKVIARPGVTWSGSRLFSDNNSSNNIIQNFMCDNPNDQNTSCIQWSADFRDNDVMDGVVWGYTGEFKNAIVEAHTTARVTVYNNAGGIKNGATVVDCIADSVATSFSGNSSISYCASSDATASGTGSITNIVPATELVDPDNGDFTLTPSSQLRNAGSTGNNIGFFQAAPDSQAPSFTAGPTIGTITTTTAIANFTVDEDGTYRIVVLADGATAPTATEVLAGTGSGGGATLFTSTLTSMTATTPVTASLTGLTDDTPLDVYVAVQDAGSNSAVSAAISFSTLQDTTPPGFTAGPTLASSISTSVVVTYDPDEISTSRVVVVAEGSPAPTATQVLAGQDGSGGSPISSSTLQTATETFKVVSVSGLTANTSYDIYVALSDGTNSSIGSILNITTPDIADSLAPDFQAQPTITDFTETTLEVSFGTDENGFYRVVVLPDGATAPTALEVLGGTGSGGVSPLALSNLEAMDVQTPPAELMTGLSPSTNYDVYVALQDAANNSRVSSRVDAFTITAANQPPTFGSSPVTNLTANIAYVYNVTTTDPEGDSITLTAPSKPSWLNLAGNVLSGTPTDSDAGNNSVVLRAADTNGFTEQSFILQVFLPTAQSDTNNGEHDTRDTTSTVTNTSISAKRLDNSTKDGVVIADFEEASIPISNPSGNAPRYQHLWNNYLDNGESLGQETYGFEADTDALYGNQVFRCTISEGNIYPEIYPYTYPSGWKYIKEVIKSGTWKLNTFDRIRCWVKIPTGFHTSTPGTTNLHFGTYVRGTTGETSSAESGGGNHYYHYMNVPPTGLWHQMIFDWHPHHRRGADPNIEWNDLQYPTNEPGYNYFDLMTRFYFQFKPNDYIFPSYPVSVDWAGVECYKDNHPENVDNIYCLNGTYRESDNMLFVGWARNKADEVTIHEVRFAFTDIWLSGWSSATPAPSGEITPPNGGAYNNMAYDNNTISMGSNNSIFIAIKRQGDADNLMRQIEIPLTAAGYPILGGSV